MNSLTDLAHPIEELQGDPCCLLFDIVPDPAWVMDLDTRRFLDVNQAAVRLYGYSREEFLSMTADKIRPERDVPDFVRVTETIALSDADIPPFVVRHQTKGGGILEVEVKVGRLVWRGRNAIVVASRDVSARRRAERDVETLFEEAPVPYHEIDCNGQLVRVNRAECELLGRQASEMVGRPVWEFLSPEERDGSRASVERKLREGRLVPVFERRYLGADGTVHACEIHERLIQDEAGKVTGIRTAMLDLTHLKSAQNQVAFQAGLLDQVGDAVVAVDSEFLVTYCNRAAEQMFHCAATEVLGADYSELVKDTFEWPRRRNVRKQLLEEGQWHGDICSVAGGERIIVELSATLLRDSGGLPMGALGIHKDVTEIRGAKAARAAAEERFELARSALAIGTWELDLKSKKSACSQEILRLFGLTDARSGLTHKEWLACIHPLDRDRAEREFQTRVRREPCHREYRVVWPDGSVRWILSRSTVIRDEGGQPVQIVGIDFDITDQKKNEEQLRLLSFAVQQSPASIVITDLTGKIQYANPQAVRSTGYSLDELLDQNPRILKSGETSAEEYRKLWETIPANVWRGTFHNRRKNGELYWEAATIAPIRDSGGVVTHYVAVKEDITERRAMEAALRHSEERFRVAAQSSCDAIYEWDLATDRVQVFANDSIRVPRDEHGNPVNGAVFLSLIHPQDRARVQSALRRNWDNGELYDEEYRVNLPGSEEFRYWSDRGSLIRDAAGKPYKWVGVCQDITERRAAERANAELAAVVESADAAIISKDLSGNVLTWNPGAGRIFGYSAEEMIGQSIRRTVPPELFAEEASLRETILSGAAINHLETTRLTKGGGQLDVLLAMSPVRGRGGEVVASSQVVWDITEVRLLQRQLAQAQKLESIGQLAAGIAHEINTPIQYIGDNARFLHQAVYDLAPFVDSHERIIDALRSAPDPELADSLERTIREADFHYLREEVPKAIGQLSQGVEQVARIVHAMKEFSHPDSQEKAPVDLKHAIESTVLVSRNEWKYVADLTTDFDPELPLVPCLAGEFNQVLLNLIVNAAHAISDVGGGTRKKGAILISTRRNGAWAEIRVADNGSGIPEAIQRRVFDPFFTTKEVGKGTGQGLSIAHGIVVKKHGGRISFETRCGRGTTFLIELPLEEETF